MTQVGDRVQLPDGRFGVVLEIDYIEARVVDDSLNMHWVHHSRLKVRNEPLDERRNR